MSSAAGGAFRRFLNSETGPKTVHFWAPTLKWALVFAGISDIQRPVDKLSGIQNLSLLATGVIWTRWSFVIKPKNMLLASVNFFLAGTAGYQLSRIWNYRMQQGDSTMQAADYVINGPRKPDNKIYKLQGSSNQVNNSMSHGSAA
ncbi:LAFA_0G23882g1_1 [Lachancea sp. 'fantastica']|nr:LAFA_0G23882g1_1 [Lachancea sp. 'fantastica']